MFLAVPCAFVVLALSACSAGEATLEGAAYHDQIKADHALIQNTQEQGTVKLSLEEAIKRGIQENMDARVSALEYLSAQSDVSLEKLGAFPSVKYSLTRNGRSNTGASSSMSAATGLQSLEPSISSDQYRTLRDIDVNWNFLDVATALMQTKQAGDQALIAGERHRKVLQNIRNDVYVAYWRALAATVNRPQTERLLKAVQGQYANIDSAIAQNLISTMQAEQSRKLISERATELEAAQKEADLALIELKSLLSLPQDTALELTSKVSNISQPYKATMQKDMTELEMTALENRPEMREAFVQQNVSARDTRMEILKTIPGAELFFGHKNDTNSFLADNQWQSFSASIVQNITALLTLPTRHKAAKNKEAVTQARRLATATAILTQVNLARHGLAYTNAQYQNALASEKSSTRLSFASQKSALAGSSSGQDALVAKLEAQTFAIKALQAHAAVQGAYAALVISIGSDLSEPFSIASLSGEPG